MKKIRNGKSILKVDVNEIILKMKLLTLLIFIAFVSASASSYSQATKFNLDMRDVTIGEVFQKIEEQSEFVILYNEKTLDIKRKVDVIVKDKTVENILDQIFKGDKDAYRIFDKQIAIYPNELKESPTDNKTEIKAEQKKEISGVVKDSKGVTLPGVTVLAKGTILGTITDAKGQFKLNVPSNVTTFVFSFVGMKTKEISINAQSNLNVTLEEDKLNLDEVVVIGYGTQAKRDITGAITSISGDDMETNSGGNINTALQGKVPGMEIVSSSGEPGGGASIKIRGASSINGGSEPLYIIDGVPIESANITSIDGDATFSPLASINPNDIESVEVLKDAASAAIYGSRAANGVVIITTKGGNKFESIKPNITFGHTSSLVSNSRKLDVMNGDQFRTAYAEARNNNGQAVTNLWVINPYHPYYNQTTNWQDVIFRTAYQTRNDLSLRGSSDRFSYGISLGYRDLEPVVINTGYNQLNLRTNFSYKLTDRISGGTNVSYSDVDYNRILSSSSNYYSTLRAALFTNPCFAPYDPVTGELTDWLGVREQRNPLAMAKKVPISFDQNNIILNQYIAANLTKGLTLRTSLSTNIGKVEQSSFHPKEFDSNTPARDLGSYTQNDTKNFINENTLTYSSKFKFHRIGVVLGQSIQSDLTEMITLNGQGYIDSKITPIQSASKFTTISRTESERVMLSFFGRANYDYKGRYLTSFTLRRDGSSRFGPDKRFGNFPSASIGWRFSDEKFMQFAKNFLRDAKLRASAGVTGNQSISNYAWRGAYTPSSSRYDGNVIIDFSALTNTNLGWETTTQYNTGLDLTFFNSRVLLTADAYIKNSEDLLFNFPLGFYTGFSTMATNFGSVENRGLEFLLETINTDKKEFKWKTSFNLSFNRNKITSLPRNEDIIIGNFSLGRVGEPMGVFFAHKAIGVYSRDEDNIYVAPDGTVGQYRKGSSNGEIFKGGDMKWSDIDKNGIIDDNDREIIGDPNPKFIGGMSNSITYKTFSLSVLFQWSYGNKVMNELRRLRNQMQFAGNLGQDALQHWRKQGDVTEFPMIRYGDSMENFRASSFNMEDASFLRLKEIVLGYSLPTKLLRHSFVKSVNFYISGTNLLTWSKYSGYDPEVNSSTNPFIQGVDNASFPKSRSLNMGITVQL